MYVILIYDVAEKRVSKLRPLQNSCYNLPFLDILCTFIV